MPTMSNLSLTNKAGTAVTATALTPSAGDSVAARWRIEDTAFPPSLRPVISVLTKPTKSGMRQVDWRFTVPRVYTDINTNLPMSDAYVDVKMVALVPQNIDTLTVNNTFAYMRTAFDSALAIAINEAQIAPT